MNKGIYSLAGFISKSSKFLILWSDDYLHRKWCVYELAACTRVGTQMEFAPVFVETFVLGAFCLSWITNLLWLASALAGLPESLSNLVGFIGCSLGLHWLRVKLRQRKAFTQGLMQFDLDKSSCRSAVDSKYIDSSIIFWYGSKDKFNTFVRTSVVAAVKETVQHLPYGYACAATFPLACAHYDGIAEEVGAIALPSAAVISVLDSVFTGLCFFPLVCLVMFHVCEKLSGDDDETLVGIFLRDVAVVSVMAVCFVLGYVVRKELLLSYRYGPHISLVFACICVVVMFKVWGPRNKQALWKSCASRAKGYVQKTSS